MKFKTFVAHELKLGLAELARVSVFLGLWTIRILLRLAPLALLLFFLGGGSLLLRSCVAGKITPDQEKSAYQGSKPEAGYTPGPPVAPPGPLKDENLQSQIRAGQSELRSWDYTLRSAKRDIERWFRKK